MSCCDSGHCTCRRERNIKWAIYAVIILVVGTWMWYESRPDVQQRKAEQRKQANTVAPAQEN